MAAHVSAVDRQGLPMMYHIFGVVSRCDQSKASATDRVVALLHDSVEDGGLQIARIRETFGNTVADAVDSITQRPDEPRFNYFCRIYSNEIAFRIKRIDHWHNTLESRLALLRADVRLHFEQKYAPEHRALMFTPAIQFAMDANVFAGSVGYFENPSEMSAEAAYSKLSEAFEL